MNPAERVRCNMGTTYGWLTTIATFTGSKPAFCYLDSGHDALRLRRGKPRPAGKNKPSAGRGAYAIRGAIGITLDLSRDCSALGFLLMLRTGSPGTPRAFFVSSCSREA
jgi:hypothetical protein